MELSKTVPNERRLNMYADFNQTKEGYVTGSQPWAAQMERRSKYDAWAGVKGKTTEYVMDDYIEEIECQKTTTATAASAAGSGGEGFALRLCVSVCPSQNIPLG